MATPDPLHDDVQLQSSGAGPLRLRRHHQSIIQRLHQIHRSPSNRRHNCSL
ncbi:hypothetical protein ACSBR2_002951 [Camellia fascicularis]